MSKYRNMIIELFDEGLAGKDELFINLVNWLSEQDAREFVEHYNEDVSYLSTLIQEGF